MQREHFSHPLNYGELRKNLAKKKKTPRQSTAELWDLVRFRKYESGDPEVLVSLFLGLIFRHGVRRAQGKKREVNH